MRTGFGSDVGRKRENNEDSLFRDDQRGLFAVADGMGGHPAGDVAAREAIAALADRLTDDDFDTCGAVQALSDALVAAHEAVVAAARVDPDKRGMGTTAVVVHVDEQAVVTCSHIGDSRAYVLTGGRLLRVTEDHVTAREAGRLLTQALGTSRTVEPDAAEVRLEPGDKVLLCTDGLTDMVSEREIRDILGQAAHPQTVCDELIAAALDAGGLDNITCIVIDV